jgi:hypothetical protein
MVQVHVPARVWGFKSLHPHHNKNETYGNWPDAANSGPFTTAGLYYFGLPAELTHSCDREAVPSVMSPAP